MLTKQPDIAGYFRNQISLIEIFELIGAELNRRGQVVHDLKELSTKALNYATILNLPSGKTPLNQIDPNLLWFVNSEGSNYPVGSVINPSYGDDIQCTSKGVSLIGFADHTLSFEQPTTTNIEEITINSNPWESVPFAPEKPEVVESSNKQHEKYPYIHGRGPIDATLACFQMLSQYWNTPWKRDVIKRTLDSNFQRTGKISIDLCGAVAELMGFKAQRVEVPAVAVSKLPTPSNSIVNSLM